MVIEKLDGKTNEHIVAIEEPDGKTSEHSIYEGRWGNQRAHCQRGQCLVGVEDLASPAFIESDIGCDSPLAGGVFINEEVAREPGDLVLSHGNLKFPCTLFCA